MAMINCPECGKEISDKAATCPNCGAPVERCKAPEIEVQSSKNLSERYRKRDEKSKASKLSIVSLVLSIIGCTYIFGAICAIIDLLKKDGRKKTYSIIALCICAVWFFLLVIVGLPSSDKTDDTKTTDKIEVIADANSTAPEEIENNTSSDSSDETESTTETQAETESNSSPEFTKEEFAASCQQIPYKNLLRNPDDYIGQRIKITAKIQQVMQGGWLDDNQYYRVQTDNDGYEWYFDDEYFMYDYRIDDDTKLLQDDVLIIYAEFAGLETVTRALTSTKEEVPAIKAYYVEIIAE